ncbi:MAG: hypothetical protein ACK4MF_07135 [Hyphomicrobiaceae bacterium]
MFSLRAFMLMALTIYLLPTDPAQQRRFMEHANAAATWAATFCDRNVGTCEVAGNVWSDMKQKATFAAGMIYDIATRTGPEHAPSPDGPMRSVFPAGYWTASDSGPAGDKGTLTRDDLRPVWRGHPTP